jgi:hypothetical protein
MSTQASTKNPIRHLLALLAVAAVLGGCASGVTRMDTPPPGATATRAAVAPTVRSISLKLSEDAKKLVADNLKFNADTLRSTIERTLAATGALKADATQTLDVEITSFRVRSNFSAIMWGFMAGNDNVEGIVTIRDAAGAVLKQAKVSAAYALGGLAGGQDDARMSWLYEEFAKHTAAELAVPVAAK